MGRGLPAWFAGLDFWACVHDEKARVAEGGAKTVQIFEVHLHQVGELVVAEGGVGYQGLDDEDLLG